MTNQPAGYGITLSLVGSPKVLRDDTLGSRNNAITPDVLRALGRRTGLTWHDNYASGAAWDDVIATDRSGKPKMPGEHEGRGRNRHPGMLRDHKVRRDDV